MRRGGALAAIACAAAQGLVGCRGVQTMLDPAGDQASHIDTLWRTMLWVCGAMYVLVLGFLAWALIRARRRTKALRAVRPERSMAAPMDPMDPMAPRETARGKATAGSAAR